MSIRRVGIVAKQGLVAASEHVSRVGARLRERGFHWRAPQLEQALGRELGAWPRS